MQSYKNSLGERWSWLTQVGDDEKRQNLGYALRGEPLGQMDVGCKRKGGGEDSKILTCGFVSSKYNISQELLGPLCGEDITKGEANTEETKPIKMGMKWVPGITI